MSVRKLGFLVFGLFLTACTFPGVVAPNRLPDNLISNITGEGQVVEVTTDPNAVTPTPFLPIIPTAQPDQPTPTPIPPNVWGDYLGPTAPPNVEIPPPVDMLEQPAGQVNILLMGSDLRPTGGGYRTDAILLVTINPQDGSVHVTSFPRDLYVYIPGWTMQRINTAMQHGDFEMVQDTFAYNFGVIPDHYILIHLFAFQYVVDNIGGVYVNVGRTITDQREGYGEDYTMRQGVQWMDGETALWYVRARKTSSDFDRTRRQQEVLIAIFNRLASLDGIRRAPELFELYSDNVVTDLGFSDLTSLVGVGARVSDDPDLIETYAVGSADITFFRTNTGASVLLPKRDNITTIIKDALNAR